VTAYSALAIEDIDTFLFGTSPYPVVLKNGLSIGGGQVYPEVNFTLPGMTINAETMSEVREQYLQMVTGVCNRAVELYAPGLVVEFELLPDLTLCPEWGAEITSILREELDRTEREHGLKTGLRVTPNDIREFARPPLMRHGELVETMFRCFELCAKAGADMLAIESTGGKEIHDDAILNGDLHASVFALGVLASRDMGYLWDRITEICKAYNVIPSGDSACGFANTAMVLAEGRFVPRVWAATIRVMSVARSLVAFEHGAVGPNKDCAYEGPFIKAITGCPISLEGAEAACAHLSPIGNIAKAVPDLWSNESVNNVKLLAGMAPTVSLEQLVYASRVMNRATARGRETACMLRDLWAESDASLDPQAYVLRPDIVLALSREIVDEPTPYSRTRRAATATLALLQRAVAEQELHLSKVELRWLDRLSTDAATLPENEEEFITSMIKTIDPQKVRLEEYNLEAVTA
jgi:methanol--5-hydroxybenzimidazolylcobamide Co-methyltransferase